MEEKKDPLSGIKIPNIVVGVLIYNNEGEILLAQIPRWRGKWAVVGGHVEYGESLEECAKREVKEETGLEITDLEFIHIQESIFSEEFDEQRHFIFINYAAKVISSNIRLNYEIIDSIWIKPKDALKLNINLSTQKIILAFIEKQLK